MLKNLQVLHNAGLAHRDLKPANIVIGLGKERNKLYLIDFGLTKKLTRKRDPAAFMQGKVTGTALYSSINAHIGCGEARKADDIESLLYLLVFFYRGTLPWRSQKEDEKKNYLRMLRIKQNIRTADLFQGFPDQYMVVHEYIRTLPDPDDVDYSFIEQQLR